MSFSFSSPSKRAAQGGAPQGAPETKPHALPEGALTPAVPTARSLLDAGLRAVSEWPPADQQLFVASFASQKTAPQVAAEFGLTPAGLAERRRDIVRRFMRASQAAQEPEPVAA